MYISPDDQNKSKDGLRYVIISYARASIDYEVS